MSSEINDKHLTMIQGVISRLAGNSFSMKGWSVTLVSALLALGAKDGAPWAVPIALLPALVLWGLDGYYLALERLFRDLYARVISDAGVPPYSMKIDDCTFGRWLEGTFRPSVLFFHIWIVLAVAAVFFWPQPPAPSGQPGAAAAIQPAASGASGPSPVWPPNGSAADSRFDHPGGDSGPWRASAPVWPPLPAWGTV